MRPHPFFKDRTISKVHVLGDFTLRALSTSDLQRRHGKRRRYQVCEPGSSWPEGLTKEKNLIDLAWHQREFESRRSFAWVIEDVVGEYLGCLYVYPSISGEKSADVAWWWRTGIAISDHSFREQVQAWLSADEWPRLSYHLPKR
jgi:hypothetical protein